MGHRALLNSVCAVDEYFVTFWVSTSCKAWRVPICESIDREGDVGVKLLAFVIFRALKMKEKAILSYDFIFQIIYRRKKFVVIVKVLGSS
jgi:hypothetical protein